MSIQFIEGFAEIKYEPVLVLPEDCFLLSSLAQCVRSEVLDLVVDLSDVVDRTLSLLEAPLLLVEYVLL